MSRTLYRCVTGGAVALAAATAKSVIGVKSAADFGVDLKLVRFGFDGVTASGVPVLVELCYSTYATNGPGTNSTSVTPVQTTGRVLAHGVTAAKNWTSEPTALTVVDEQLITPAGGLEVYDFPLGDEPDSALAEGFVLRFTAPAIVNVRTTLGWART